MANNALAQVSTQIGNDAIHLFTIAKKCLICSQLDLAISIKKKKLDQHTDHYVKAQKYSVFSELDSKSSCNYSTITTKS